MVLYVCGGGGGGGGGGGQCMHAFMCYAAVFV